MVKRYIGYHNNSSKGLDALQTILSYTQYHFCMNPSLKIENDFKLQTVLRSITRISIQK